MLVGSQEMIVTAVLAIRNEEECLANCLRHLVRNDINFVIIDNESTDESSTVYGHREFARHLVTVRQLPFRGSFCLIEQMRCKNEIIKTLDTDWVVHLDADEIMHSTHPGETLKDAIGRLASSGANAIDFDEFVFLPLEDRYVPDTADVQPLLHYYFFQPHPSRLMRAWQKASGLSSEESGGHTLSGPNLRLAPEALVLRHYIFSDQDHAFRKYTTRQFATTDLARGFHSNRVNQPDKAFRFPPVSRLKALKSPHDHQFERDDPWRVHYWQLDQSSWHLRPEVELQIDPHKPAHARLREW